MQPAGWIGHHQFSHLHRQGIRQPAGVDTVHHGIGAWLLQAGVGQAPDRQGQGVNRTHGIQPGVVGHRDDQSQILAAIQGLLRQLPAPVGVWGLGSRQIPDDLASVGWHAGQGGQTLGSADVLVAWEEGALLPGALHQ